MKNEKIKYVLFIAIPVAVGALSGFLTRNGVKYYNEFIKKPSFTPPPAVFPIVWTTLFILMGISTILIYRAFSENKKPVYTIYGIQLFINFIWSIIFFNFRLYLFSSIWILLLIISVIIMIMAFYKIKPLAAYLQIPYLLWICFATYLNFGVYLLNRVYM